MEFDHNIVCAAQDDDILIIAYQDGGLGSYDWTKDKIIDEIKSIGPIKSIDISRPATSGTGSITKEERVLVCGGEAGEILVLRP